MAFSISYGDKLAKKTLIALNSSAAAAEAQSGWPHNDTGS